MLVITWCTFLFAAGLPILFPIAAFGMIVLYITNRLSLAYWNKRPPVYDYKLNETTIQMLSFAPVLYICVGAWVYSNQQTFYNRVQANKSTSIFMPADH